MSKPLPSAVSGYLHTAADLAGAGLIAPEDITPIDEVTARYSAALSPELASLIDRNADVDPIALQFVPDRRELHTLPEEAADPIGDKAHSPVPGIVHRYPDRVLLMPLTVCPVYCRFCFRRESVGPVAGGVLDKQALDAAIAYIEANPEIWEVILTGGDPLGLSARRIADLMKRLSAIEHVKLVRIHTRVPAADPRRITSAMVGALKQCRKTLFVGLHVNHPREMSSDAQMACARIIDAGIPMISQSVLLKGVNDNLDVLTALMRCFLENRIKPYYLHHPDLAPGTSHFRLTIEEGQKLVRQLRGRVSGLAQPHYVIDIPGGHGKSPAADSWIRTNSDGSLRVDDWQGHAHYYR